MSLLLNVSEVSSSSARWSLLALLGLVPWENSSSMLPTGFVQMAGNSVVDVPRSDTSWYELYIWWLSWRWRSRRQRVSSCWKWGRREWQWRLAGRGNRWRGRLVKKNDHTARSCEWRPRCSNSQWTLVFVEGSSVQMYEHRREWNIVSQLLRSFNLRLPYLKNGSLDFLFIIVFSWPLGAHFVKLSPKMFLLKIQIFSTTFHVVPVTSSWRKKRSSFSSFQEGKTANTSVFSFLFLPPTGRSRTSRLE